MDIHQARCKSIQREQREANFLKTRIKAVERQQETAARALELARRAKNEVETELASLRERYTVVTSDLAQQRERFQRDFMAHCPPELLALIFAEAAALPDYMQAIVSEDKCFDKAVAAAPFQLAAVCSRWREVALRQPSLWTYITSRRDGKYADKDYVRRNTLVLERSRDHPLDIFLCWDRRDWAACAMEEQLLKTLGTHAQRWRSFELWLPDDCCKKEYVAPLVGTLPLLQRLCFVADNSQLDIDANNLGRPSIRNCLQFAPELREAVMWGPNSFVRYLVPMRLPAIRTLRLHQYNLQDSRELLLAAEPTLDNLVLTLNGYQGNPLQPNPLSFARLRSLALLIADEGLVLPLIQQMDFPAVDHLTLSCFWIEPRLRLFLEQIAPSVTKLTLTGPGATTTDQLATLSTLANVQELHFGALCPEVTSDYDVSESIFAEHKTWVQDALWPKLSSVVFSPDGKFDLPQDGHSIVEFVRWRTEDVDREANSRVCRLRQFLFGATRTPPGLVEEIHKLLHAAPRNKAPGCPASIVFQGYSWWYVNMSETFKLIATMTRSRL